MRRLLLLLGAATTLAGCGAAAPDRADRGATLALTRSPDAVEAGIHLTTARGYDAAEGVKLTLKRVRDPLAALRSGRAQLAVADIHDLAVARARGADVVAVMALVERPITRLRPARYRRAGARTPGAPSYPELVLCTLRQTLTDDPAIVRGAVAALQRGYREAFLDPESAVEALLADAPGLDRARTAAALDRLGPAFQGSAERYGALDPAVLRAWARWEARSGIVARPPDVAHAFDDEYVTKG